MDGTTMGAALGRAGCDDPHQQLRQMARDVLARVGADYEAARQALELEIFKHSPLHVLTFWNLVPPAGRHAALDALLSPAADEMRAGRGQARHSAQQPIAPPPAIVAEPEPGHCFGATQEVSARPARQPDAEGSGQRRRDTQDPTAAPSAARVAGMVAAHAVVARSVLDTFEITERQGSKTPIGDVRVSAYPRLIASLGKRTWVASREYNLLTLLAAEAKKQAHVPAGATTRDLFSADAVAALVETATGLATPKIPARRIASVKAEHA